tara:strand:+ start:1041 stop:2144 length:1104 start_codon:yes stop_codon:yes gene_type:complete
MKTTKIFQILFKKIFQKIFILFYGKIKKFSDFNSLDIKKISLDNITSDTDSKKKYFFYEIIKGRVYTDTIENVAIIKNNTIVPHISFQQIHGDLKSSNFNIVLKNGTPRLKKKFNGTVLSLVQGASGNNYFHFLFDIITRLKLCEEKYQINKIDYFYVPEIYYWQRKIFKIFGIENDRLINSQKDRHIEADKILAIDHPWYYKGRVHDEVENIPSWIVFWLRNKFINMATKFNNNEKVFIDRSESQYNHCQFQNNDEIINFLNSKGFKSYKVGQLDFFEQIFLFNNAKIIIGPHGAAFTNIIFCKPKTSIVEIIPENHPSRQNVRLSKILDLNLTRIITPALKDEEKKYGDIKFSIEEMNEVIKKII